MFILGLLVLLFAVAPADAQTVYRWVDERGGVHYSGHLEEVPERYRSQTTTKEFAPAPAPAAPAAAAPAPPTAPGAPAAPGAKAPAAGAGKPAGK